jgi:phosphatidate phosphatase APP1
MPRDHKRAAISALLQAYPALPFILIGDSGENDPEVYSDIVRRFPKRIRVIYIRSVNRQPRRAAAERLIQASELRAVRSDRKADEKSAAKA